MLRPAGIALLALAALVVGVAPAGAQRDHRRHQRPHYRPPRSAWATVNVCDTRHHPDTIGIRASMPGDGHRHQRMLMRFRVQFRAPADGLWHNIAHGADSGWVHLGSALRRVRRSGYDFRFDPPPAGARPYVLRGAVTFEWRRHGKVVHHRRERTRGGHPTRVGADPPGYSAPTCEIR